MSEQMIIVPNHVLKQQQQALQGSVYLQQQPQVQYVKQVPKETNNIYIQSPVIKKSINSPTSQQILQQSIQSPKIVEYSTRQSVPQVSSFQQSINSQKPATFTTVTQQVQNAPVRIISEPEIIGPPVVRVAQSQLQLQPILTSQMPNQVIQLVQHQQPQAETVAPTSSQPIVLSNKIYQQIQNQQQLLQEQEMQKNQIPGIFQLGNVKPDNVKQQRNLTRKQSLQNLQSYQSVAAQQAPARSSQYKQEESTNQITNNVKPSGAANVRSSLMSLKSNPYKADDNQNTKIIKISQNYNTVPSSQQQQAQTVSNGSPYQQDYVLEQQPQSLQASVSQQVNNDKKPLVVKERIHIVQDTAKIEELEGKIKTLLDNIEQLNKTIYFKESENADLSTKLLEIDHLNRAKTRILEENQTLKLQIEEWQRRYNVLELQIYDKPNNQFIATGYTAYDAERLYNTLKIKQEENEALKTTIARLELNQGQEKTLKEEIYRLNDLLELKTKQAEEWKTKYMNQESLHSKYKFKADYGDQIVSGTFKDNVQVNSETPKMSMIFNEQNNYQLTGKDITQLGRLVHEKDETPKRSAYNSSVQYNTSALFKKKNGLSSPTNIAVLGATSYLDDLKQNKKQLSYGQYY